ncbi:FTSH5 [Scenedesmus sp. PABB004]|nr:FTSH5 [Scenedesmus sp. PABB004]
MQLSNGRGRLGRPGVAARRAAAPASRPLPAPGGRPVARGVAPRAWGGRGNAKADVADSSVQLRATTSSEEVSGTASESAEPQAATQAATRQQQELQRQQEQREQQQRQQELQRQRQQEQEQQRQQQEQRRQQELQRRQRQQQEQQRQAAAAASSSEAEAEAQTAAAAAAAVEVPLGQLPGIAGSALLETLGEMVNPADPAQRAVLARPSPLPHKDHGVLRGGQYPFGYDPVYGLPIVHDVLRYGELLRDVRSGGVSEVLWFTLANTGDPHYVDGRCLVRYADGRVAQSVVPPEDFRVVYAMQAHGVKATKLPLEPRHIAAYALREPERGRNPFDGPAARVFGAHELDVRASRRGPRLAPSFSEAVAALPDGEREAFLLRQQDDIDRVIGNLERADTEDWEVFTGARRRTAEERDAAAGRGFETPAAKQTWSDRIIISQDMQVLIYKWVPIVGPVLGSAFVIGLYLAARLLRGDLTDRMALMDEGEEKRRRTALREARIAFLEEEVPALVARRTPVDAIRKKAAEVNKKLGDKFEISEAELLSTVDACTSLLAEGQDIDSGAGATQAAERILAQEEADARAAAEGGGEGGGEAAGPDALMEMGKLNTARVRKAIDPKILDVKKRVRAARRSLKRESKVVLSDEIIFFDDVAGNEQAKVELMEVVDFFRKPEKFRASGARPPKGVLLVGPPGNGKTLMARAVAGESGVAFISSSASEFIEMYMGLGAARVRDLFNTARKLSPCIIFIDELDAVGRARRSGAQGGNDERDNTVNQLLTELDGFSAETQGIVVMGATNRKDVLDPALTRPGRFDRSIEVRRPDYAGRLEGIKVHLREKPIGPDIDYAALAALTGGMSGAQLAGAARTARRAAALASRRAARAAAPPSRPTAPPRRAAPGVCNTACFLASRAGRSEVRQADLVAAVEQTKYGKTYEASRFVSPGRKRRFAVVEAGFCVAAALLPAMEAIDYVTILPSIKSPVGRTVLQPSVGRYTTGVWTRTYLEQQLRLVLAGRAAEELVFGVDELSSLHQHKIMMARQVVHKLLNSGFSSHPDFEHIRGLGTSYLDASMEPSRTTSFITVTDYNQSRSEWVDVDIEMEELLNGAYAEVKAMLSRNRGALDALTDALLASESMQGPAVYAVIDATLCAEDAAARAAAAESEVAFL